MEDFITLKDFFYLATLVVAIIGGYFSISLSQKSYERRIVILEEDQKELHAIRTELAVVKQMVTDMYNRSNNG